MGGRDIGVVSMVLTLGWGGEVRGFVGLACLTSSRSSSGLLFSAGVFCLQGSVMCACVCAWNPGGKKHPLRTITPKKNEKTSNKLTPQTHASPPPTQCEDHRHYTYITTPHNTYPTKEVHTPPFNDPLDIPL